MELQFTHPSQSPFHILYVDVTHKCNMACTNCYVPNRTIPDMDLQQYTNFIKQLPQPTEIRLIGGEPTLNSQLTDFIKITKFYKHRTVLVTNGLKLADFNYSQALREAGLEYVYISASGFNDDSIYEITDNLKCAEQKLMAIAHAESLGMQIGIGCLLMAGVNTHIVSDLVNYAASLKAEARVNFRNVGLLGRYTKDINRYLTMDNMVDLLAEQLKIPKRKIYRFQKSAHQIYFYHRCSNDKILRLKVTDWQPEGQTLPDPGSMSRGRVTKEYQVAPFFEHIKANEFGY